MTPLGRPRVAYL